MQKQVFQVCIPLFWDLAAGLGSYNGTEKSGQESVVGTLIPRRAMFLEMKGKQQQEQAEEEQALFGGGKVNTYFRSF